VTPGASGELADLSGRWRATPAEGDLAGRFLEPSFDDCDWADVDVPGHWRSTSELAGSDGPVLYRRQFALDACAAGRRRFVEFDGVFYQGDVWLDAGYLGATEGYFFPHSFEIGCNDGGENRRLARDHTLAVEVACPPQRDRTAKRLITGVFSHWDNLDPEWNPGGLWRPVRVVETGPVRIGRVRCVCTEATEERGRLALDLTLDPGDAPEPAPLPVRLTAQVRAATGQPGRGALLHTAKREIPLAGGDNHLTWVLDVDDPPRWWPWRLGEPAHLVEVEIVVEVDGEPSDRHELTTAFREVRMRRWQVTVNGEGLFVMGSNQGPTRMALADATPAELAGDIELARAANLDLVRVHAHVSRPETYAAADAAGMLLWQDFPLQWGYGLGLRRQAVRQARAMVDVLGHHPSVALWCAHNEPLAVALQPGEPVTARQAARFAASMFLPSWNKDVLDRSVARALSRADSSRPVDRYSGVLPGIGTFGTDTHWYFGWYHGELDGLSSIMRRVPRLARFVTEFGAQAVPDTHDFMEPGRWPDLDWEQLLHRHACQRRMFDRVVPPADHATFDGWRAATQEYQAALIQLQVEDLRRLKRAPTGGFCHFCFADGHPAVTWSVLDHARAPKLGFEALRAACRTVLPMIEPRAGLVHVVSEARLPLPGAVVDVEWDGRRLGRFTGDVPADGIAYVGRVSLDEPHGIAGDLVVTVEHERCGRVENTYTEAFRAALRAARSG